MLPVFPCFRNFLYIFLYFSIFLYILLTIAAISSISKHFSYFHHSSNCKTNTLCKLLLHMWSEIAFNVAIICAAWIKDYNLYFFSVYLHKRRATGIIFEIWMVANKIGEIVYKIMSERATFSIGMKKFYGQNYILPI